MANVINTNIDTLCNDYRNTLQSATNHILSNTPFNFNNQLYKRLKGQSTGSPISNEITRK